MKSKWMLLPLLLLSVGCMNTDPGHPPNSNLNEKKYNLEDYTEDSEELYPHTGNPVFENETKFSNKALAYIPHADKVFLDKPYYVQPTRLNVRSGTSTSAPIVLVLNLNDKVYLASDKIENDYVEILSFDSNNQIDFEYLNEKLYVHFSYIALQKNETKTDHKSMKYFMVQNIASETLRIYEKMCEDGMCSHKMILETDMAVGEPGEFETITGYFHITEWIKFYQDGAGLYPSWYHPNYPMPPAPGASVQEWTKDKYLPYEKASVRGAFGWYTAKVGPNAKAQWTHGTIGWGADKKEYIEVTKGVFANIFFDPRSHGCSRTDNESIAYIRHLIDVGTPIIKIYAKEAYGDKTLYGYSKVNQKWSYILTKNGSQKDGQKADREQVLNSGVSKGQWIEEGSYSIDAYPTAKPFLKGRFSAKSGEAANIYGLDHDDMRGVYLVDKGLLIGYENPSQVQHGGYKTESYPAFVRGPLNVDYSMPECPIDRNKQNQHRGRKKYYDWRCTTEKPIYAQNQ